MLTKEQENVLKYLLTLLETSNFSTPNQIMIGIGHYDFCKQTAAKNIAIINTLDELGYIRAKFMPFQDGTSPCIITLNDSAINYRFHKKQIKKQQRSKMLVTILSSFFKGLGSGLAKIFSSYLK